MSSKSKKHRRTPMMSITKATTAAAGRTHGAAALSTTRRLLTGWR